MSSRLDRITDEAALWFVRVQAPEFSGADREEFASWLAASAEHVLEYLSVAAVSSEIRESASGMDVDALVALARERGDQHNVVAIHAARPVTGKGPRDATNRRGRRAVWTAAASVAIMGLAGIWFALTSGPLVHTTGVGEQAAFPLSDGSVVVLNTQSSIEVDYTETDRMVRLLTGEVLFEVREDADRPFRVLTDLAVIRAVGTVFNVRRRGEATNVTVIEGTVDVRLIDARDGSGSPALQSADVAVTLAGDAAVPGGLRDRDGMVRLDAGEQARVDEQSHEVVVLDANTEDTTAWRERRLIFESQPLADVVAEFNLYGDRQIEIGDSELADRSISGSFDADDPESFALFLSTADLVEAVRRADGTIVLHFPREAD